ncbi:hypothetical protein SAMN05660900_00862 [Megasphaera cerevisiae DSM 20462]|nr:hypothetical protein SAMN05660900_00862 [Megasphaera cerevisiae DSM 20462]
MLSYYGDKLSPHMIKTPEGFLICKDVRIGRTGDMMYLSSELPPEISKSIGKDTIRVKRTEQSLFSKDTIASFEGKPITDEHPTDNLTVDTATFAIRGHVQNVRRDGTYLVGDLYVTDTGLINKIENKQKREVSCGYFTEYILNDAGEVEQTHIIGNHVAVVANGRAGHSVAIHDKKPKTGGTIMKNDLWHRIFGLGLKEFAKDADPEELAAAMKTDEKEDAPATPKETKDEYADENKALELEEQKKMEETNAKIDKLAEAVAKLTETVTGLVESDKDVHKKVGAEETLDGLEKELSDTPKETKDEDADGAPDSENGDPDDTPDNDPDEEMDEEPAKSDESVKKIVKDMKPIIMSIQDEKIRNEVANKFAQTVRDSRPVLGRNQYTEIIKKTQKARQKQAQDAQSKTNNFAERAEIAAAKWNNFGKEGK